jgi:hypothetical protein
LEKPHSRSPKRHGAAVEDYALGYHSPHDIETHEFGRLSSFPSCGGPYRNTRNGRGLGIALIGKQEHGKNNEVSTHGSPSEKDFSSVIFSFDIKYNRFYLFVFIL